MKSIYIQHIRLWNTKLNKGKAFEIASLPYIQMCIHLFALAFKYFF